MDGFNKFITFDVDEIQYIVPIKYVSYIVAAADSFLCIQFSDKKEKSYIGCILGAEGEVIPVIEITGLWKGYIFKNKIMRPLILILSCNENKIGLLTDKVSPPIELSENKSANSFVYGNEFIRCDTGNFILFDVPKFLKEIKK